MRIYFTSARQSFGITIWAFYAVDCASASLRFRFDHGSGVASFFDSWVAASCLLVGVDSTSIDIPKEGEHVVQLMWKSDGTNLKTYKSK